MPQGVRDGEPRHVVHRLPLEEGLPEVYRLRRRRGRGRRRGVALHAFLFCFLFFYLFLPPAQRLDCQPSSAQLSSLQFSLARLGSAPGLDHSSRGAKPKDSGVTSHLAARPGFPVTASPFPTFPTFPPLPSPSRPPVQLNSVKSKRRKQRFKDLSCLFFCFFFVSDV